MTRVVVQRGQSSSNARSASATTSAASAPPPPPPPPPPSRPIQCIPGVSGSGTDGDSKETIESFPGNHSDSVNELIEGHALTESEDSLDSAAISSKEEGTGILSVTRVPLTGDSIGKESIDTGRRCEASLFSEKAISESTTVGVEEQKTVFQTEASGLTPDVCGEESYIGKHNSPLFQSKIEGPVTSTCKSDGSSSQVSGSSSHRQGPGMNQPSFTAPEPGSQWAELTASLPSSSLSTSSVILPSSRRGGWFTSNSLRSTSGPSRKGWKNTKSSKSPPHTSCASSPRSYAEQDGYNSADEQNPWKMGQRGPEESEERERQFEVEIRRHKGLEVRRMAEDGNCLFRAVADQVYGDPDMHFETRQMCIDYMEKERDHFSQFVTESFSAYCKRKRRDRVFGNNLEIQAMAEMYNRQILIYCYGLEPKNIFQGNYETDLPPIRLSYHRNDHYNSLVDPNRPTIGAGLGFGSLSGANVDRDQVKAAIKAQQDMQIDKALLAEGRYYSDLELTEQEMERMVIEESRAEFLAEEYGHQLKGTESSTSAGTSTSQSDPSNNRLKSGCYEQNVGSSPVTNVTLTANMRNLLSMGFNYFRVVEACNIFGDDINDILCYLLEAETGGLFEDSIHRLKGKAAER
ncbi:hypothetical protein KP509_30G032800 [Ceratopteris richardii]|uniref:ubiquitinyl hydrolase 1 n=1 Tax=Ceratopteris richardii TaxID=49495 RepID=A0A8T2R319_CERRI|nr:hypothetical protein KP509_30G032800 [Ceratopteris richardii]KAH7290122.1 hypothetical protein KP509_30G032800 [Ceratopteris richardii]